MGSTRTGFEKGGRTVEEGGGKLERRRGTRGRGGGEERGGKTGKAAGSYGEGERWNWRIGEKKQKKHGSV